jgi:hypothetical protein
LIISELARLSQAIVYRVLNASYWSNGLKYEAVLMAGHSLARSLGNKAESQDYQVVPKVVYSSSLRNTLKIEA